jgi:formylglycine-generating enzyme required for sulfatase activity
VGSFKANGFGLYEMQGNVWQWVEDAFSGDVTPSDGTARSGDSTSSSVLRGGSWYSIPDFLRSADRNGFRPDYRGNNIGFRVARTLLSPSS